jgi:hypothetical protein
VTLREGYQGKCFFFFLLEDSFFGSEVVVVVTGWHEAPAAGVPEVLAVAVESAEPVPPGGHAPPPIVAGVAAEEVGAVEESDVPAVAPEPCAVFPIAPEAVPPVVAPPVESLEVPGALGVGESGPFVPTCASPVEPGALDAVASEVPVVPALPEVPGVTVSTTAVVPAPLLDAPGEPTPVVPGVSVSDPASLGGSRLGGPTRAAIETSGPFFSTDMPLFSSPPRGRGSFCSCCIRAIAPGSGCGTGAPIATSLAFASPASGESG